MVKILIVETSNISKTTSIVKKLNIKNSTISLIIKKE